MEPGVEVELGKCGPMQFTDEKNASGLVGPMQRCLKAISLPTELAYLEHSLIHENTCLFLFLGRGSVAVQKLRRVSKSARLPKVEIDGGTYHGLSTLTSTEGWLACPEYRFS